MSSISAIGGHSADLLRLTRNIASPGGAQALQSARLTPDDKIRLAAQQFEGFIMRIVLKQMRDTVPEGGLLPKNSGEKMFQDFLDDQMASEMTSKMGLGLSDALIRQLLPPEESKNEEVQKLHENTMAVFRRKTAAY